MGKNFCVCNEGNHTEHESNIFSGMQAKNLEKETIKTLSASVSDNHYYTNKLTLDDKTTNKNCGLDALTKEINKNNNYKFSHNSYNNKMLSEINKHDNFQCSGKFNVIMLSNGGNEYNDNNSLNISDKKDNENGGRIINKNVFSFNNFKTFIEGNNNFEIKANKDNNTENSEEMNNEQKSKNDNKNNENNYTPNGEQNFKDNKNGNDDYGYNNISHYDDESNKEYLNNESNYYNSNKREENRDNKSLDDEHS
jgi:hypothetical protein